MYTLVENEREAAENNWRENLAGCMLQELV